MMLTGMISSSPILFVYLHARLCVASDSYEYPSFDQILSTSLKFQNDYPNCVRVYNALDKFPNISPSATCGLQACQYVVMEIGSTSSRDVPQVFLSGSIHGNERPGPLAVIETVRSICEGVSGLDLNRISIIAVPTANAIGYYRNVREDAGIDPNRDFPYDVDPSTTLGSTTAKIIFSLFQYYGNVQSGITFHAGTQSITYPWGSYNHLSHVAPDDAALAATAALMQAVSGKTDGSSTYPIGTMNDVVYPVNGGFEDWAYALGFESSPFCANTSFSLLEMGPICNSTLPSASIYLVETSHEKEPPVSELGSPDQLWTRAEYIPIIPRLVRMSIKMIDVVYPTLKLVPMSFGSNEIFLIATGCVEISLNVEFVFQKPNRSADFIVTNRVCSVSDSLSQTTIVAVPIPFFANNSCVGVGVTGTFDSAWSVGSPQLGYAKNRKFDLGMNALPTEPGYCSDGEESLTICISRTHLFIHPGLIRYKPTIEINGKIVSTNVSSVSHELPAPVQVTKGSIIRLVSYDGSLDVTSRISDDVAPSSPSGDSNSLLFLLFLILIIPIGYILYRWFQKRSRKGMYQPATGYGQSETA
jgi:hypothetical protein